MSSNGDFLPSIGRNIPRGSHKRMATPSSYLVRKRNCYTATSWCRCHSGTTTPRHLIWAFVPAVCLQWSRQLQPENICPWNTICCTHFIALLCVQWPSYRTRHVGCTKQTVPAGWMYILEWSTPHWLFQVPVAVVLLWWPSWEPIQRFWCSG